LFQELFAQTTFQQFKQLQPPVKRWVIFHPFIAKKTFKISKRALFVSDSISKAKWDLVPGRKGDAFRHGFWMASLATHISAKKARNLGKAYEKGNYRQFKRGELEDGAIQDSIASAMDLYNNEVGIGIADSLLKNAIFTEKARINAISNGISNGDFKIVSMQNGQMLDCNGNILPEREWKGKWNNKRCLVYSSYQ
jgi:hypothetical protein